MPPRLLWIISIYVLFLACHAAYATDTRSIQGVVRDSQGQPAADVDVASFWRTNGTGKHPDGTPHDLADDHQLANFWGHVGEMQPSSSDPQSTDQEGRFHLKVDKRARAIMAIDPNRRRGGIAILPDAESTDPVEIKLVPLVKVRGRMRSVVSGKSATWTHVYVELPFDPEFPIATNRLISCGSFHQNFQFQLPPGSYTLHAYGISDKASDDQIDLEVQPHPTLTLDGTRQEIDLGTLELKTAPLSMPQLTERAQQADRWQDVTEHYGDPAPNWHAVDTRDVSRKATVQDFRGKWLVINFWGLSCAPCIARGIPELVKFQKQHADFADRFQIIGLCVTFDGEPATISELETAMAPIIKNVWNGRDIPYPIILDNTFQTCERYGIKGLGTTILISPDGKLHPGDLKTLAHALKSKPTVGAD